MKQIFICNYSGEECRYFARDEYCPGVYNFNGKEGCDSLNEEYILSKSELDDIMSLGMMLRQDQLSCRTDKSGVEVLANWIKEKLEESK